MMRTMRRSVLIAAVLALVAGFSASAGANPFVVDTSGAGLSLAAGCLVSESFCDPTDANDVALVSSALATGTFTFSTFTAGPATLTFTLNVPSATLDDGGGANPTVDEIQLTNVKFSGTVNVNITDFFGLKNIAFAGPGSVTAMGDIEIFQGGGSLGSTPFNVAGVGVSGVSCNFFNPVTGGLCGVVLALPGTLPINVGGQDISLESFQFNPTLVLPEPVLTALLGIAGLALMGRRLSA